MNCKIKLLGGDILKNSENIGFENIDINQGFWQKRQKLNAETTIYSIWKRFEETGRFSALNCDWKEGELNRPHIFFDSDTAKWIESVGYILQKRDDEALKVKADELIDIISKNQEESGYFNSWFQQFEPKARFTRRDDHELYCAGHLMEAAVAYYYGTGKDKLLKVMCRYADYIEKIFKIEKSAKFVTCGHPEIELALIKLYHCTGEIRYLELSRWFIDMRGNNDKDTQDSWRNSYYSQDHLPLRQQKTAEGHSVRAAYMYSGMADIAYEYGDTELVKACENIFDDIINKKMYITGGIGSSHRGEAFTVAYDLPNETAYAESCAAIALAMFSLRMQKLLPDVKYADTIETILYNGFLVSTSLDGKSFFYENPLSIDLKLRGKDTSVNEKERMPITERLEVFDCSCCPPNITRFVASLGDYLYTVNGNDIYTHQYVGSMCEAEIDGRKIKIRQETDYPTDGKVKITVMDAAGKNVFVRIPSWCEDFTLSVDGSRFSAKRERGYIRIPIERNELIIDLDFTMDCHLVEASPFVHANTGKAAIQKGPIVYCIEAIDNGENIQDIMLKKEVNAKLSPSDEFYFPTITIDGFRRHDFGGSLYRALSDKLSPIKIKLIPYYAFANRGESDMQIWTTVKL